MFAAKQFAYLLPDIAKMPVTLVSVNTTTTHHLESGSSLKELLGHHYPAIKYEVLNGAPDEELYKYLKAHGANSIVVMGAYGRNALARFFQQSMSNRIIKDLNLPVFITHQ
jgi:nucleotide-binding universal stress UspA family protein